MSHQESIEINDQTPMETHALLTTLEKDRKQSVAEEKNEQNVFLVEQISLERKSPPSFIPEVIDFNFLENTRFFIE